MIALNIHIAYEWGGELAQNSLKYGFLRDLAKSVAQDCQRREGHQSLSIRLARLRGRHGAEVLPEIRRRIQSADVLLFDIADWNPNVLVELGIALAQPHGGPAVFIFLKEDQKIPSDLQGYLFTFYRETEDYQLVDSAGFRAALYSELLHRARAKGLPFLKADAVTEEKEPHEDSPPSAPQEQETPRRKPISSKSTGKSATSKKADHDSKPKRKKKS